jgi:hypothetical protein
MGLFDNIVSFGTALRIGVISVGKDVYFGAERTAEGLGAGGYDRAAEIGLENDFLVHLLPRLFRGVVRFKDSPLYQIVETILEKYYEKFPEDALNTRINAAGITTGYLGGRMGIGRILAGEIAARIAVQIAETTAYKELAKKLGVSAAADSTGVGIPIGLIMAQGVAQRASRASQRLKSRNQMLWSLLRAQAGLDMIYFLVEDPMAQYLDAIDLATSNPTQFEIEVRKVYN